MTTAAVPATVYGSAELSAVRSATSRAFVIGLRICADEGHAGGLTEDVAKSACIALDQGNDVDYFSLTLGTVAAHGAAVDMIAPMGGDHARIEQRSGAFRTALSKVLVAGRIHQMAHAETLSRAVTQTWWMARGVRSRDRQ